jgi:hypothetical protein
MVDCKNCVIGLHPAVCRVCENGDCFISYEHGHWE